MKFKIKFVREVKHQGTINCLDWKANDVLYSVGDDHQLYKWDSKNCESIEIAKLPDDFVPSDLHWLNGKSIGISSNSGGGASGSGTGGGAKGNDTLLISSIDGRFVILNRNARVEKNVSAHSGCITTGRWSPDGSSLLTAGEDGMIKVWSRSGMLRSTVIQNEGPIRCAQWCPQATSIAYCQSEFIAIKPLAANSKLIKWRAHDGMVLCLNWSNDTQYLASGGEDCRYKVWDKQGANIYSSILDDFSITSIEFSPNGQLLAVGGFNMLKLCSFSGWSYSNIKFSSPTIGSIYRICWTQDSTQIAAGTSTSNILYGYIIEQERICRNLRAITTGRKTIQLQDLIARTSDILDFSDRIINWSLGYGHLVIATVTQIHIYNEKYINTPLAIIDGRNDVRIIMLGKKYLLIVDIGSIWIYTYNGRLHLNPKYIGSQLQIMNLTIKSITFGLHYIAIRDYADQSVIRCFDLLPSASRQNESTQFKNKINILEIAVCRAGNQDDQYLAFIDVNYDLFITSIENVAEFNVYKIGTQVISIMWSSESNILVGLHDACYSIWYCPGESAADPTLIALTTLTFDTSEFGKNVTLEHFDGPNILFKCSGALYTIQINLYCEILHRFLNDDMWLQALKLCRHANNHTLWATLAAIASKKNQNDISEEAYSASLQIDKVNYLQYIKNLQNSSAEQMAENSIMMGRIIEAETILLHNRKITEAILLCLRMHRWERALDIAETNNVNIDVVLDERKKYLKALEKMEFNEKFLRKNITQ